MKAKTKSAQRKTPKPRKSSKADNPEQYERFREFAREHETDNDPEAFDSRFRKIVPPKAS